MTTSAYRSNHARDMSQLSPIAEMLITATDITEKKTYAENVSVNPVVAEVASWYEKLRNAMIYEEDEVILRTAIERILNRRLLLGGNTGEAVARPLVRELVWARYFPDSSVPETLVKKVELSIDLHLHLQRLILHYHNYNPSSVYEWILQLLSSDIENILSLKKDRELLSNFMFQILKSNVSIIDDLEETKDAQVFISIRRAFAKEDLALLRYHLFVQFFGPLSEINVEKVAQVFVKLVKKIDGQIKYTLKERIYSYVKNQNAPFFILEDLIKQYRGELRELVLDKDRFEAAVLAACANRYKDILSKVSRAIFRSVIFIFITKVFFALVLESTFENLIFGSISWSAIAINTLMSPLLMIIASLFIRTPDKDNSKRILEMVNELMFEADPHLTEPLTLAVRPKNSRPWLLFIFGLLWFFALVLGVLGINTFLSVLHFNVLSKIIFILFLMIVSFLSYRINQTARMYTVKQDKESFISVLFDFFLMPFIWIGKQLTLGMSQINIMLFIFDFLIETPFKSLFAFFEHWFLYLKTQRETLD